MKSDAKMLKTEIWLSFQTQVDNLFSAGYNLPGSLHIVAIETITGKVDIWKESIAKENRSESADVENACSNENDNDSTGRNETTRHSPYSLRSSRRNFRDLSGKRSYTKKRTLSKMHDAMKATIPNNNTSSAEIRVKIEECTITSADGSQDKASTDITEHAETTEHTEALTDRERSHVATVIVTQTEQHGQELSAAKTQTVNTDQPQQKEPCLKNNGLGNSDVNDDKSLTPDVQNEISDTRSAEKSPQPRQCQLCQKVFKCQKGFDNHAKLHKSDSYPCSDCHYVGYKLTQLTRHRQVKHGYKDIHPRLTVSDKLIPCTKCEKSFTARSLQYHMKSHDAGPRECPHCSKELRSQAGYDNHIKLHTGQGLVSCTFCSFVTGSQTTLKNHVARIHKKLPSLLCDLCGRGFYTNHHLRRHREGRHLRHLVKDRYSCEHCKYKTHCSISLKAHVENIHQSSDRHQYECPVCGIKVKYKQSLTLHLQRHSAQKSFPCHQCSYKGVCRKDVQAHIRRLHMDTSYKCQTCSKTFKEKGHLSRHLVVHTGEKQFLCHLCSYRCNVKGNLSKHLKVVHKVRTVLRAPIMKFKHEATENESSSIADYTTAATGKSDLSTDNDTQELTVIVTSHTDDAAVMHVTDYQRNEGGNDGMSGYVAGDETTDLGGDQTSIQSAHEDVAYHLTNAVANQMSDGEAEDQITKAIANHMPEGEVASHVIQDVANYVIEEEVASKCMLTDLISSNDITTVNEVFVVDSENMHILSDTDFVVQMANNT